MPALLSWPFRGWRVALLLVATACATPGRAKADCGDHVLILNGPTVNTGDPTPTTPGTAQSAAPHKKKAPCSGPNCSRSPQRQTPPPAPAPTPGPQGKEAAHTGAAEAPTAGPPGRVYDSTSPPPVRRADPIFHPPRIG
jgi:hypothetical protein